MWQSTNTRAKALQSAKKRQKARIKHPLHFRRVIAEVRLTPKLGEKAQVLYTRLILNDFTAKGLGFFAQEALPVGRDVAITIDEPRRLFVKGHVTWCQEVESTHKVLSKDSYNYRVGIAFTFSTPEEEKAIQAFCDEVLKGMLYSDGAA